MSQYPSLAGLRILVVEDDVMVSMMVEDMLQALRCEVVAAVSTAGEALNMLRGGTRIDGVLLDLHLRGRSAAPVVNELMSTSRPFIVTSGGDSSNRDPPAARSAPRLVKPFSLDALGRQMTEVFGSVSIAGSP